MPKIELEDIRLAMSPLTERVYAGVLDKKDKPRSTWLHNQDVSKDFINCMCNYLKAHDGCVQLSTDGKSRFTIQLVEHT